MEDKQYDSTVDTMLHIMQVQENISKFSITLINRGLIHDQSKLRSPEKELFDKYTPLLKTLVYNSDEYKESLNNLKPALDHHYANNSHHPEYYTEGIDGMDLLDLVEMYCDWLAAIKRNKDGDFIKSLEINSTRFNMSPQLIKIFTNTFIKQK